MGKPSHKEIKSPTLKSLSCYIPLSEFQSRQIGSRNCAGIQSYTNSGASQLDSTGL